MYLKDEESKNWKIEEIQLPLNAILIKKTLKSISKYNENINKFLNLTEKNNCNYWENSKNRAGSLAREYLVSSFVGVLAQKLGKLNAISIEDENNSTLQDNIDQRYINECRNTCKTLLKLINFVFISKLWDLQLIKSLTLSNELKDKLQSFFETYFDAKYTDFEILNSLFKHFKDNNLDFPMEEIKLIENDILLEGELAKAIRLLHEDTLDAYKAETYMTLILEKFDFLSVYKMISTRSINYNKIRNDPPVYFLNYAKFNNTNNENIIMYEKTPTSTDTILIFKEHYHNCIDLFPFIIDISSINFENGINICFFNSLNMNDDGLEYIYYDSLNIEKIPKPEIDFYESAKKEDYFKDKNNLKKLKLATIYGAFQKAKSTILG